MTDKPIRVKSDHNPTTGQPQVAQNKPTTTFKTGSKDTDGSFGKRWKKAIHEAIDRVNKATKQREKHLQDAQKEVNENLHDSRLKKEMMYRKRHIALLKEQESEMRDVRFIERRKKDLNDEQIEHWVFKVHPTLNIPGSFRE
ncbi:hypothetical protein WDU94_000993 [Cyamophila willieti]